MHLLRVTLLIFVLAMLAGVKAAADPPTGPDSDVPCGMDLVGTTLGVADPRGSFTITIRDIAHNPVVGIDVSIDFSGCPDIRIAQVQPWPGIRVECNGGPIVHGTTDEHGSIDFRIVGSATNIATGTPGGGFRCAVVRVDPAYGGNLGTMNVAAFDENGVGGLNPADISVWLPDAFAFPQAYVGRSDFNCTNSINPADLAMLLNASLGSGSTHSGSPYCQ